MMRMRWFRAFACLTLASCALFPSLDGLTGGDASTADAADATSFDAAGDASVPDADAAPGTDAGDAGADADAATCGFPGPTTGLIAYYPFEEGQGSTIHDCSPNHFDGAFVQQGVNGNWATGKKGGAILVQSTNGCVDVGAHAAFQPTVLSVAAWVNVSAFPSVGASGYIVGQSLNADVDGWRFGSRVTDAGSLLGWEHTVNGTHYILDAPAPAPGAWHHVAITLVNGNMQIYLDGTLTKVASGFAAIAYDAANLRIGCRADGANSFDGYVDEVRLYNRALTSNEITSLAQ